MKDRFKFRVWWEQEKRYRVDAKIHPIEKFFRKGFIIEQCTGLKDKNGNLIYEGDIVQYSCGKGVVRFGKYTGCFACGWENIYPDLIGWYLDDYYEPDDCGRIRINFDNTHSSITEEYASDFEIIGNIHEQSEQKDK